VREKSQVSNLKIDLLKNVDPQDIGSLLFYRCDITCSESNFHLFMNIYKLIDIQQRQSRDNIRHNLKALLYAKKS
jgi:hypothetical protein